MTTMLRFLLHGLALILVLASVGVARAESESDDDDVAAVDTGYFATVRLTYYLEDGLTFSGGRAYSGSAACSWNFPIGAQFEFPNGEQFTCNDRGLLGSSGWLDLWRRADLVRLYGSWVTVRVF